uniref:Uncharacterized protein n=1 Tax=Arundo donax TaxID=35708 RepID=A0A0A9HH35_ARUDO
MKYLKLLIFTRYISLDLSLQPGWVSLPDQFKPLICRSYIYACVLLYLAQYIDIRGRHEIP